MFASRCCRCMLGVYRRLIVTAVACLVCIATSSLLRPHAWCVSPHRFCRQSRLSTGDPTPMPSLRGERPSGSTESMTHFIAMNNSAISCRDLNIYVVKRTPTRRLGKRRSQSMERRRKMKLKRKRKMQLTRKKKMQLTRQKMQGASTVDRQAPATMNKFRCFGS